MIKFTEDKSGGKIFVKLRNYGVMTSRIRKRLRKALDIAGEDINRETVRLIVSPPKTGRLYPFSGGLHQASASGQAPANKTGNLVRSNYYKVRSAKDLEVGETAEYAGYLEDGTNKMQSRPHLITAINNNQRNLERLLDDAIEDALP